MNLFGVMETSGSAMQAERMRAEVVAANMANAETTRTASGQPYHRQNVVFASGGGETDLLGENAGFRSILSAATGDAQAFGSLPASLSRMPLSASPVAPGVRIAAVVEDTSPPLKRYDPGHPDADSEGYVAYPNINPLTEMVDLMGATRAYGLNSSAVQAEKSMILSAIEIVKS